MAMTYYQRKTNKRMLGLIDSMGFSLEFHASGELGESKALCYVFAPQTKREDLDKLVSAAEKCFRKCEVYIGKGTYREYAKEIVYPNVYIRFNADNG